MGDQDGSGQEQPRDDPKDLVQAGAYLGRDQGEPSGFGSQFEGERVRSHPDHHRPPAAGHDQGPGQEHCSRLLGNRGRLTCQKGFIRLHVTAIQELHVSSHLFPGAEQDDVIRNQGLRQDQPRAAVPDDPAFGRVENGQPVQGLLGAVFLDDSDQGIPQRREAKERIPPLVQHQQQDKAAHHDGVEERQDVRPDNIPRAAACCPGDAVDPARVGAYQDLGGAESVQPRLFRRSTGTHVAPGAFPCLKHHVERKARPSRVMPGLLQPGDDRGAGRLGQDAVRR